MDEKEILKKLIAGEYFEKGDYFTEKQLKSFNSFVLNFREVLEDGEKKNYFRNTIESLIFSDDIRKVLFGINFGRYYPDDGKIGPKLKELVENPPNNFFKIRVQAIYELLVKECTEKEKWYNFLTKNLKDYKQIFREVYRIDSHEDKAKYFNLLIKKLSETPDNKRWVYFIELVALEVNKEESKKKIAKYLSSEDKFVSKVAKQCLDLF